MKKIGLLVLLLMILLCADVQAEEMMGEAFAYDYTLSEIREDNAELFAMNDTEKQALLYISRCVASRQTTIGLASYNISTTRLNHIVSMAFLEAPDLCYVSGHYRYYYNEYNGYLIVTRLEIEYPYSDVAMDLMMEAVKEEKEAVVALVDENMSDLEKVMAIHNYIVSNHEYDYTYTIYDIYGFFTQRTGTCSAYAKAMTYFLRELGIECSYARSDEMNHVWNVVKLDGMWYHIDATWDDPNDRVGYGSYKYFLKSDEHFRKYCDHYSWESDYEASSAWYDDYYFEDYYSPLFYYGGEWYGEKNGCIYKIQHLKYGGEELVYKSDSYYWSYMEFGIYEDSFVYNLKDGVYVYNPNDYAKQRKIVSSDKNVYSLKVDGNKLYYQEGTSSLSLDNVKVVNLDEIVSVLPFELLHLNYKDGKLHVSYTYDEYYDMQWRVFAAAYDKDGILICVKELPKNKYSIEMPVATKYEAFIWEGCMPLCDSVVK